MKPSISTLNMLKAEIYKTLHNRRIVALLCSPLIIYLLIIFYAVYKSRIGFFDETSLTYDGNPWLTPWSRYTLPILSLVTPPAIITLSYLICDMEYLNDNIRMLFALPVPKWKLYLSKAFTLVLLITALMITMWVGFVMGGYMLGYFIPAYKFTEYTIWEVSTQVMLRSLLASLSVGVFGLAISLFSRNFTLPILLGFFLTAFAVFVTNEQLGEYLPFATFTYLASLRPIEELTTYGLRDTINLLFGIIMVLIGYHYFTPERGSK